MKLPDPALLLITDRKQAKLPLVAIIEAALGAGCRWVGLREKDLSEPEQAAWAAELLPIVQRAGGSLTLHGDPTLAQKCGVDGVHLAGGGDPLRARRILGPDKLLGISIHSAAEARTIEPALVDYAIAGPAFDTASKPGYGPPLSRSALAEIARACPAPVLAIGGIDRTRAAETLARGVSGLAVMGSIMRSTDPAAEVSALIGALQHHNPAA